MSIALHRKHLVKRRGSVSDCSLSSNVTSSLYPKTRVVEKGGGSGG